jgi:hypothetical protein
MHDMYGGIVTVSLWADLHLPMFGKRGIVPAIEVQGIFREKLFAFATNARLKLPKDIELCS